jgi:hypothetical protein
MTTSTPQAQFDWGNVLGAVNATNQAAPQTLSGAQRNDIRAGYAAQGQTTLGNNLASMAQNMGGVTNPAYAAMHSRMAASQAASTGANMSQVDIDENKRAADLEMQRRAQQIQGGNLALGQQQAQAQGEQFYASQALEKARMRQQGQQFWASLLGGPGGTGGGGGGATGAGGGYASAGLAGAMSPIYEFAAATGTFPRAMGAYNRLALADIYRAQAHPATMDTWLQNLQRVLGFGSDNS